MVLEVNGNFGKCTFIDCFDGMKRIPDNEYDFSIIDPPWGVNVDGTKKRGISKKGYPNQRHDERINYDDKFDPGFNKKWFDELQRISKVQVVCIGRQKEYYWIRNFEPIGSIIIVIRNPYGSSKVSKFNAYSPYFLHGDLQVENKLFKNVYFITMQCGFLNNTKKYHFIHPSPKNFDLWRDITKDFFKGKYEGKKIIDIFGGTSTLGEVGESLGIQWQTFEIKEDYLPDVEYRIERGIRRYSYKFKEKKESREMKLDNFIQVRQS